MASPASSVTAVSQRLQSGSTINPSLTLDWVDDAIQSAMQTYSQHRPDEETVSVDGKAGKYYVISGSGTVLTNYEKGFSEILSVEYPALTIEATTSDLPVFLDLSDDIGVMEVPNLTYLVFPTRTPGTDETFRVRFTKRRVHTADTSTVLGSDLDAVLDLAAARCCDMLSTHWASASDQSIAADTADHGWGARRFREAAERWELRYLKHMGMTDEPVKAASAVRDWDSPPSWFNQRWLTHDFRRR